MVDAVAADKARTGVAGAAELLWELLWVFMSLCIGSMVVSVNFPVVLATPSDSIIKSISDRCTGRFWGKFRMFRGSFLLRRLAPPLPEDEGDVTGNDCGVRGGATLVAVAVALSSPSAEAWDVVVVVGFTDNSQFSLIGAVFARGSREGEGREQSRGGVTENTRKCW